VGPAGPRSLFGAGLRIAIAIDELSRTALWKITSLRLAYRLPNPHMRRCFGATRSRAKAASSRAAFCDTSEASPSSG
jgi:hypothetical protein